MPIKAILGVGSPHHQDVHHSLIHGDVSPHEQKVQHDDDDHHHHDQDYDDDDHHHQVAMSVHVNKKFKAYKSGIFNDPDCPKNSANHALLTVG